MQIFLSEEEDFQNIARSDGQKPVWVEIFWNYPERVEAVQNISSRRELKKRLKQYPLDTARHRQNKRA